MNGSRAVLALVAVAAVVSGLPAPCAAADVAVVVVPPFELRAYADRGAVGLVVPGAGATVSRRGALAALLRGKVENAALGGVPTGRILIRLVPASAGARSGPTVYVSLPPPGSHHNVVRYPIAVVGSPLRGRLESSTTGVPGLLSIADVAPLARALAAGGGGPVSASPDADVASDLRTLDDRLTETHDARAWATPALVGLMLAAIGLAAAVRRPALGRAALLVAPATLGASLALSALSVVRPTALDLALTAVGAALTVALAAATARRPLLAAALCGTFVLYLVVLLGWPAVNSLAVIGPHPDGGVRFYGVTNEVETLLLVPALAAVSLLGLPSLVPVGLLALATIGLSATGADAGGVVVFAAAFLTFAVVRLAGRLSARRLALVAAAALVVAVGLVGIDAAAGGSSHGTSAVSGGPGALFRDAGRRLHLSALQATSSWHAVAIVVGCLAIIAFLVTRRPVPASVQAAVVAVLVSLVVNDSPTDVISFGALATGALLVWERTRTAEVPP